MILQGANTLYDRQGRLGLLQALAHTPPVDVTVTVIVIFGTYSVIPFVYISVLCINLCMYALIHCACMCVVTLFYVMDACVCKLHAGMFVAKRFVCPLCFRLLGENSQTPLVVPST